MNTPTHFLFSIYPFFKVVILVEVIHLYYHGDRSVVLQFFEQDKLINNTLITPEEGEQAIIHYLQLYAPAKTTIDVFLTDKEVIYAETMVSLRFNDTDILQYITLEQAKLFPMLEEKIYFDFFQLSVHEENQKIAVVACNATPLLFLQNIFHALKLRWHYLGLRQVKPSYNLLPWRELAEKESRKKFAMLMLGITLSIISIVLLLSLLLFYFLQNDRKKERQYYSIVHNLRPQLIELEKVNDQYQQALKQWRYQEKLSQQQAELAQLFMVLDVRGLENIELNKIAYEKKRLRLQGRAQDLQQIDGYLSRLRQTISAQLISVDPTEDKKFSTQFEIEVILA